MKILLLIWILLFPVACFAQHYDTVSIFSQPIQMDEVVIKAARKGWDINAFIRRIQTDTTFYKAFRSMHLVPYTAVNDIKVYDRGDKVKASLYSKTEQKIQKGCRITKVLQENVTGDFYKKNGDYRYYTAQLYAYLFFSWNWMCGENDIVAGHTNIAGEGRLTKSAGQLKQLIFNPGSKVDGVPLMRNKASVFDPGEAAKYDYKLSSDTSEGQDCYVFAVTPKKGEERNVVFKSLVTWFRKSDYSIIARDYSLSYSALVYDFNVDMKVRTQQVGAKLLPVSISYNGNWHVFTQKRERVKFTTQISYLN